MRKIKPINDDIFHLLNRGVDKRTIFEDDFDYLKFFESLYFQNSQNDGLAQRWKYFSEKNPKAKPSDFYVVKPEEKFVDILCYCLNPNHYHILAFQLVEKGIEAFMHKLGTSFTMYFNNKHVRSGSLFQGPYKSVKILSGDQLSYVSAYINGNSEIHKIADADQWAWSSYNEYFGNIEEGICVTDAVTKNFKSKEEYKKFMLTVIAQSAKRKEDIKKYLLE